MKKIRNITCSGLKNPLGIDREHIDFSWQLATDQRNIFQESYEINVWDENGRPVWASGPVVGGQSLYVPYGGAPLTSKTGYEYRITLTDNEGSTITSDKMTFETGMDVNDWKARWIGRQIPKDKEAGPDPNVIFLYTLGLPSTMQDVVLGIFMIAVMAVSANRKSLQHFIVKRRAP